MRSRAPLLIVLISLLILSVIVFFGVLARYRQLNALLPAVIQNELQLRLHRNVRLGTVKVVSSDTVAITDLTIGERPSFGTGDFFYARQAIVRFRTADFLFRLIPTVTSITSVTLIEPHARLVRNKQGVLNVSDLLQRPKVPPTARFRGLVSIRTGSVTVVDYMARTPSLPAANNVNGIAGRLNFGPPHSIGVDLIGSGMTGRLSEFRATGQWGLDQPLTDLSLSATNANLPYWFGYFTRVRSWAFGQGLFSGRARIRQPVLGGRLDVRGSGVIRNASITSTYLTVPVKPLSGNISFIGTRIALTGTGALSGSPVSISGRINGLAPAVLDLRVASSRMNLNVLQRAIRATRTLPVTWGPTGSFDAHIVGVASSPTVTATVRAPSAVVSGTPFAGVVASGSYKTGVINITSGSGIVAGGRVSTSAVLHIRPFTVSGSGTATGVNLAAVPYLASLRPIGRASGTFTFAYRPGVPTARAQVALSPGQIDGIPFSSGRGVITLTGPGAINAQFTLAGAPSRTVPTFTTATATVALRNRTVTISRAVIITDGGRISATGTAVLGGPVNLSLTAQGISAQSLLGPLGYTGITGTVSFTGRVGGTTANPQLMGSITAQGGQIRSVTYESLTAQLTASRRELVFRNMALRSASGNVTATGTIALIPNGPIIFNTTVAAERVDLAVLTSLLGIATPASGIASASLSIQGSLPNIRIAGQVSVTNAMVAGIPIDTADVRLQMVGTRTVITELIARRGNMELIGSGSIGPGEAISLDVRASNLDLSLLNNALKPYIVLAGPADAFATVTGTLTRPILQAQLTSTGLTINGQRFDSLTSSLTWDRSNVVLRDAALVAGPSSYRMSLLRYVPATKYIEVSAAINAVPIPALVALLQGSPAYNTEQGTTLRDIVASVPQPATGTVNAAVTLATSFTQSAIPTGSVTLAATGLSLASTQYGDVNAALQFSRSGITVQNLSVTGPLGRLTAQGTVSPAGELSLAGRGEGISLAILRPWLPKEQISGTVDFAFTATGTLEQPQVVASLSATNIMRGTLALGTITADRITIANDRLSTDRLVVQQNGSTLVFSGYLPFSLTPPFIPRDQPLSVAVTLSDPNLAFARYFPTAIQSASGSLTATAQITGTLNNPVGSGTINLQNGFFRLAHFENNFMHVTLAATLQGSQLTVDTLSGESSLGGTFTGGGTINLGGQTNSAVALFLSLNALRLSETNLTASQGEHATLTVTGRLEVAQTIRNPIVQGQVVVSDANIVVPAKPVTTAVTVPALPISTQLAVTVNLARNVTIRRGGLVAQVIGPLVITGTSTNPVVSGTVQIASGRISYPGRTLELLPGGTASLLFQPPKPAILSVDVTAATTVTSTSTFAGFITRYRVFFDITGPVGDLSIGVRTSPPGLGDLEALAAVFGGTALEALIQGEPAQTVFQQQIGQLLLGFVVPGLFQPIELGGGLTLTLEPGSLIGYTGFTFTLSEFVTNNLSLSYTQSVAGGIPIVDYGVNYTFTPQLAATVQFESQAGSVKETLYLIQYYKRF